MANNPTLLLTPIAESGNKNAIPLNQSSPGQMSQDTGFPPETSLPLGAGGVAPSREDFNGAFNLLGGVAFYAQKGFSFNYDSGQDYYVGCVVIDAADGKRYQCIADMTAGTVSPSNDTTHTYWKEYTIDNLHTIGAYNKKVTYTSSGTFSAPVTGVYRITLVGGGGGGGGGGFPGGDVDRGIGGGGGGQGGIGVFYETLTAGTSYSYVIGAGGTAGAAGATGANGANGGDSSIVIGDNTYSCTGGTGGDGGVSVGGGGAQGLAYKNGTALVEQYSAFGVAGGYRLTFNSTKFGATPDGIGGGTTAQNYTGGGGHGGFIDSLGNPYAGSDGKDGRITFEYYDPTIA